MMSASLEGGDVYLKPGEMFLPDRHAGRVLTVLGSCVAVALYDPERGMTSLCHGVYPRNAGRSPAADPRYVQDAIALMLDWYRRWGVSPAHLVAKLFGGAVPVFGTRPGQNVLGVGSSNVEAARQALSDHGVPLIAQDVGGRKGRRLVLDPSTGAVRLFRLPAMSGDGHAALP